MLDGKDVLVPINPKCTRKSNKATLSKKSNCLEEVNAPKVHRGISKNKQVLERLVRLFCFVEIIFISISLTHFTTSFFTSAAPGESFLTFEFCTHHNFANHCHSH